MEIIKLILFAIITFAVVLLIGYLISLLLELHKTIKTIREGIVPAINQIGETVAEIKPKVNGVIEKIDVIVKDDIAPLAENMRDITGKVNESMTTVNVMVDDVSEMVSRTKEVVTTKVDENIAKVDVMVDAVEDMVEKTHEVVNLYQQKAVIPAIEIISIWSGVKKGIGTFFRKKEEL